MTLEGIWFAVKEAAFPLLIGLFVFGSIFTEKPFFKSLLLNPAAFQVEKILEITKEKQADLKLHLLMKKLTALLSLSFLLSAVLNFVLAIRIFTPLASGLTEIQKQEILNEQLSQMTLYSLVIILVPSMVFLAAILYYAFKEIRKITGLRWEELVK